MDNSRPSDCSIIIVFVILLPSVIIYNLGLWTWTPCQPNGEECPQSQDMYDTYVTNNDLWVCCMFNVSSTVEFDRQGQYVSSPFLQLELLFAKVFSKLFRGSSSQGIEHLFYALAYSVLKAVDEALNDTTLQAFDRQKAKWEEDVQREEEERAERESVEQEEEERAIREERDRAEREHRKREEVERIREERELERAELMQQELERSVRRAEQKRAELERAEREVIKQEEKMQCEL
mmetsp:Transcript_5934/g.14082  ORF Transcript_5934/g.14082 Transcript_5934/m.14082 type:complete len:235 (-) Transcript_5934:141-845(-)